MWPSSPLFAAGLARGFLSYDLSIVPARNQKGSWLAPLQPSRRVRQALLAASPSAHVQAAEARLCLGSVRPRSKLFSGEKAYTVREGIASVRQARHLKSQDHSRETARLVLENPCSGVVAFGLDSSLGRQPSGTFLRRSRTRFDVAAMLYHREWYVQHGPCFRYIACDASPQVGQSIEVFVTVERVVRRQALSGRTADGVSGQDILARMSPLVTLGSGRAGLDDKVAAHIHQVFLEYGPSAGHVAAACSDVRQVMSDMGVEFGICNFGNAIGQVLGEKLDWGDDSVPWVLPEGLAEDRLRFLYPFALQTPGVLHILDWIIRSTVEQLAWWPAWQLECKRLLQFCHGQAHRDRLRTLIESHALDGQSSELATAFDVASGRFAEWRWKTLSLAVKDVQRLERAMRFLASKVDFSTSLGSRDASGMRHLQAICTSAAFWDKARGIRSLVDPIVGCMGWLQGCDCHEDQLQIGQAVSCNFKGCRARSLSSRLRALRSQLQALRQDLHPGSFGSVDIQTVAFAIGHCLASVDLKFMWVDDLPYLVRQVPRRADRPPLDVVLMFRVPRCRGVVQVSFISDRPHKPEGP